MGIFQGMEYHPSNDYPQEIVRPKFLRDCQGTICFIRSRRFSFSLGPGVGGGICGGGFPLSP